MNLDQLKAHLKAQLVRLFLSYDQAALVRALRGLGIREGDTVMVHASWLPNNGFLGRPVDFIDALKTTVGPQGLLVMTSLTYQNESSKAFLSRQVPMNVRRSPSAMGLLTEVFRRGRGVVRSLSPTHPLLAWGNDAEAFIADHEKTDRPFGPASPFARLLERNALLLCFDVGFPSITFTHFVEDRLQDTLPFPLYEPVPMTGIVIDRDGTPIECPTRVLSDMANRQRREPRLIALLTRTGLLRNTRLGNSRFIGIRAAELVAAAEAMVARGEHFFDRNEPSGKA